MQTQLQIPEELHGQITTQNSFLVHQVYEVAEHFGFETRNKYQILDQNKKQVFFVAEQQKGFFGFLMRNFLGHWRSFTLNFYDQQSNILFQANHPFKFFFQELHVYDSQNQLIGSLKQRFGIVRRYFDVVDSSGRLLLKMKSPFRFFLSWDYPFYKGGRKAASVDKKFSGIFSEFFTDKDNFQVSFADPQLPPNERILVLASSIFIDLNYFEHKARR